MAVSWSVKRSYTFSPEFERIIRFYLFEFPDLSVSRRARTSIEYNSKRLRNLLEANSGLNRHTWRVVSQREVENELRNLRIFNNVNPNREIAVHMRSRNYNNSFALFYLIRCALAHGNFSQRDHERQTYYVFENKYNGLLKGRALLKESTLIIWIDLINT